MKKILSVLLAATLLIAAFSFTASAFTGSSEKQLINSSSLTPMKTGYTPLDELVADYFNKNFTKGMDSFEKLKNCYDFLIYGSKYGTATKTMAVYNDIDKECNYYSYFDRRLTAEAYCFIRSKIGSCNDFAGAFMVMARALGFECYVMDGTITWSRGTNEHTWCLIKLGSSYYSFDPQAEWRNYDNNGYISYSNFCIPESSQYSRHYNRSNCISKFNNFQCRNKINNPGQTIIGVESSSDPVYSKGQYVTNEKMNFRSDHNTWCTVYCIIPENTKVTVTDVYGVWGKIKYDGKTGWISLDYSTMLDLSEEIVETPVETYKCGIYKTEEYMNFRKKPDGDKITVIPSGTELNITQTDGVWGKTVYEGNTGWISLEYSKLVKAAAYGDVNGDGIVTAADARLILRHVVSLETIKNDLLGNADLDNDGKITTSDARRVLRIVTSLE